MKRIVTILIAILIVAFCAPAVAGKRSVVHNGKAMVSWAKHRRAKVKRVAPRKVRLRTAGHKRIKRPARTSLRGLARGLMTTSVKHRTLRRPAVKHIAPKTLRGLGSLLDNRGRQQRLDDLAMMFGTPKK